MATLTIFYGSLYSYIAMSGNSGHNIRNSFRIVCLECGNPRAHADIKNLGEHNFLCLMLDIELARELEMGVNMIPVRCPYFPLRKSLLRFNISTTTIVGCSLVSIFFG